ncbi:myelin-oligodendrocyte glycoprotein-like [Sparus aurata]|uniref:myelin-oligodendrocyte glycoprotein-like n=1 Tax=Sparus aurata TaxID=8175 RepID=UPI0011C0EF87|nr:myelin-oligodendrocyte glycoprotein-like [Sparus aurata]
MSLTPVPCYLILTILIMNERIHTVDSPGPSELNCPEPSMKVVAGHREMLQCSSSSPINVVKMEWLVNDTVDVYLFRNGKTCNDNQNEKYKGKTSIFEDKVSQGNFSLILTAEMSHSGKYRCAVYDGRNTIECYINVSVHPEGENNLSRNRVNLNSGTDGLTMDYWTIAASLITLVVYF